MISEPLLNAVLHCFALQSARLRDEEAVQARGRVEDYLQHHVGLANSAVYLDLYDALRETHEDAADEIVLAKAQDLGGRMQTLLQGFERTAAALQFVALAVAHPDQVIAGRIARLLAGELGLSGAPLDLLVAFMTAPAAFSANHPDVRRIGGAREVFQGELAVLHLPGESWMLVAPVGAAPVRLEGRLLERGTCEPIRSGLVLRDAWGNELHYATLATAFGVEQKTIPQVTFRGDHLVYRFPGGAFGLHDFSFAETSGRMVAIMGGSGAGKSTLLGILNGTVRPESGELLLNGRDVHRQPATVEGVIGFVPQDDLLFEDLTVLENLDFAAQLCLAHLGKEERVARVKALLADLGQAGTENLKVGSPLQKTISGGQRKRLNIALELIREPTVLFVDEPTSGLSSADSDLVMSLLRDQAAQGKLVFVVIHQPSSKIFRSFDALWMLDQGGWPVFRGTPLEAVAYFRSRGGLPGAEDAICPGCGSVNPEQLFDILEEKLIDPSGAPTHERRIRPETWAGRFADYAKEREDGHATPLDATDEPARCLRRPGLAGQLRVFFSRDVRARLSNRTYLAITLLEPPLLGLLLGLVARGALGGTYDFHTNNNLHVFFFMSVITALFLGLMVSAEEICRDARVLRREKFLHLSWWSYINAKSIYLALVCAVQTLLYLVVALPLVGVPGMFLKSWVMLFAAALASGMLGLNLSATLRSAVTIYILIPLVLIPQMLLCGVVIRYDDLIAPTTRNRNVPVYAQILPPRWAYEALVVEQFTANSYMRPLVETDAQLRMATYDLDHYLPAVDTLAESVPLLREQGAGRDKIHEALHLLELETRRLEKRMGVDASMDSNTFMPEVFDDQAGDRVAAFLATVRRQVFEQRKAASAAKRMMEAEREATLGADGIETLRRRHTNRSIERQALNLNEFDPVGTARDGLYARMLPVYQLPESRWGGAHFLARHKRLGDRLIPVYPFNLAALGLISGLLYVALWSRALKRTYAMA